MAEGRPHPDVVAGGRHPAHVFIEAVLTEVKAHRVGTAGKWQCPAHGREGEHTVAVGVGTRRDGTGAWVVCHAGCDVVDVLKGLGLTMQHLRQPPSVTPERHVVGMRVKVGFPPPKAGTGTPRELGYRHEAFHYYGDDFRKERLRHPGTNAKAMQWEARNWKGEWVPGLLGAREADMPLYRQPDIEWAMAAGEVVILVESESSVDALKGWAATTWAGGAGSAPLETIARVLGGYDRVLVIADHDDAGQRCARGLRAALPHAIVGQSDVKGEDAKDLYLRIGREEFAQLVGNTFSSVDVGTDEVQDDEVPEDTGRSCRGCSTPIPVGLLCQPCVDKPAPEKAHAARIWAQTIKLDAAEKNRRTTA